MSEFQDDDDQHQGPIRTPRQLILTILASFVIPIAVILLLANFVDSSERIGAGSEGMSEQAIAERIRPVGMVMLRETGANAPVRSGEQVYAAQCAACHAAGLANAPKFGDAAAWAPRIKQGYEVLLNSALKGKGAMAPQSGGEFSDHEIGLSVVHMANNAGGKFEVPKPPAAQAAGADAAASAPMAAAAASAPK